jgi:glutamate dehydrogenase (NAD(P)+)
LYDAKGLDVVKIMKYKKEKGSISYLKGPEKYHNNSPLFFQCDVLSLCAKERVVHRNNCQYINAKLIVEGANGPITPYAHAYLKKKGVIVIPDMFANCGGVCVSYFEWIKNLNHVRMGMMEKRFQLEANKSIIRIVSDAVGKKINVTDKDN